MKRVKTKRSEKESSSDQGKAYAEFLRKKKSVVSSSGFEIQLDDINSNTFEWQKHCIRWACRRGRAGLFEDTGLGKTLQQLEWCHQVVQHTQKPVLLCAPLAVKRQTIEEHQKFEIQTPIFDCKSMRDVGQGINITNYERLHYFNPKCFSGLALDEASILKSFDGKYRNLLCKNFKKVKYKLACSATPSPNDHMELGNQAEFLNAMSRTEMLSTYFIHDSGDTSKWRLKGHAHQDFWHWMSSWALVIRKPSDLGYSNDGYDLPGLNIHVVTVPSDGDEAKTLTAQRRIRKLSVDSRIEKMKSIITDDEPWIVWCDLNDESEKGSLEVNAVEVTGSLPPNVKAARMRGFSKQEFDRLITKPKIAGFGMNWQHCCKMVFLGLSHSFEAFYQAVRRCYRFGQTKPVDVYIIVTDKELAIVDNVMRKQNQLEEMCDAMVGYMIDRVRSEMFGVETNQVSYDPQYGF